MPAGKEGITAFHPARRAHLPIALYPDSVGYIFSGSAVFDPNNTSGLGTTDKPPLVAVFTYHSPEKMDAGTKDFQTQGLAYSLDHGRTWEKYAGNPVLKNPGIADFRDPKVFWHADTKKWIMVLAVRDRVELYRSEDLKVWNKSGDFIRLVSLPVEELEPIRQMSFDIIPQQIDGRKQIANVPFNITPSEMLLEFELRDENTNAGVELSNANGQKLSIGFDGTRKSFYVDRRNAGSHGFSEHFAGIHYAPAISANDKISLHIFLDVASVEVFADDPDGFHRGWRCRAQGR